MCPTPHRALQPRVPCNSPPCWADGEGRAVGAAGHSRLCLPSTWCGPSRVSPRHSERIRRSRSLGTPPHILNLTSFQRQAPVPTPGPDPPRCRGRWLPAGKGEGAGPGALGKPLALRHQVLAALGSAQSPPPRQGLHPNITPCHEESAPLSPEPEGRGSAGCEGTRRSSQGPGPGARTQGLEVERGHHPSRSGSHSRHGFPAWGAGQAPAGAQISGWWDLMTERWGRSAPGPLPPQRAAS